MVLGGTWRTPVAVGLQSKTFITDQKNEGTYNEASFEREYRRFVLFKLLRIAGKPFGAISSRALI
jgi:hypothetical protein